MHPSQRNQVNIEKVYPRKKTNKKNNLNWS